MSDKIKSINIILVIAALIGFYLIFQNNQVIKVTSNPPIPSATPKSIDPILSVIPALTKPMVWSAAVEGTIVSAAGDDVAGTLISSKVATKADNKFAGLLVTDSPLVTEYGWQEDPSGFASGMGESIYTYQKGTQKLIIRYKGGEYQVLLSQ